MSNVLAALFLLGTLAQDPVEEARALVEQGRSLQALQVLEEASRTLPDNATIQHALGALYAAGGRVEEALQHVERAVALAPNDTSYAYAQGELLYRSGRVEEAKAALEQDEITRAAGHKEKTLSEEIRHRLQMLATQGQTVPSWVPGKHRIDAPLGPLLE